MSVKDVTVRLFADSADAQKKLDAIYLKAEELGRANPTVKVKIDQAAGTAALGVLRKSIRDADKDAGKLGRDLENVGSAGAAASPGLTSMLTPMTGLVAAGVALSPVIITLGVGMAGFGAAAYSAVGPVLKAAQAAGGLQANMHKLNPEQQAVARGFLGLQSSYDKFALSLQPEVFAAVGAGIKVIDELLKETAPVAKATGAAFGTVIAEVGKGLQDREWRSFFQFMAQTAGPDVLLVGKAVGALASDLPPLLKALQPVATEMLSLTADSAKLVGGLEMAIQKVNSVRASSDQGAHSQGLLSRAFDQATRQLAPEVGLFQVIKTKLDGTSESARKVAPAADKAGISIKIMGGAAQTTAQQATELYAALHKLLDPLTANINDAVTFKNDQVALTAALKKSVDVAGLNTAGQRASATAMTQAAQDALTLSQSIFTQTGSARKALGPLEALAGQLERTGAKGAYARDILRELKAAEDKLYSKTINIHVGTTYTQIGAPGMGLPYGTVGNPVAPAPPVKRRHAAGGWASGLSLVGEQGAELVSLPPNSYVYNHQQTKQIMSGGSGGGGTPAIVLDFRGADQALATALKQIIRVRGGDPSVIGR